MRCQNCGKEIADTAGFCKHCGLPVTAVSAAPSPAEKPCVRCGRQIRAGAAFCKYCGVPQTSAGAVQGSAGDNGIYAEPVRVKRYGFLRFLLVVLCLLLLWQAIRIPENIKNAREGRLPSHAAFFQKDTPVPETAFGDGKLSDEQQQAARRWGGDPVTASPEEIAEHRENDLLAHENMASWLYGEHATEFGEEE